MTPEREVSKNSPTAWKSVRTAVATISPISRMVHPTAARYFCCTVPTGFDKVVELISNHGLRLIRPFLRGFGPTQSSVGGVAKIQIACSPARYGRPES